jgi:hypothetical protein
MIYGQEFLGKAGPAIAMDCVTIALSALYLVALRVKKFTA